MSTVRYSNHIGELKQGYTSISNVTEDLKLDINRIDKTIAETMKPLELVVEEQSKTIDELVSTNSSLEFSNNRLSTTIQLSNKNVNYLIEERAILQNRISALHSKYKICLTYAVISSIIALAEALFLLF